MTTLDMPRAVHRAMAPAAFLGRKLGAAILTLVGLATIVFAMTKVIPGDEAQVAAGESATPEQVEEVRSQLGLDKPAAMQYFDYLGRMLHGDLGTSTSTRQPVLDDVLARLPGTLELVFLAMVLAVSFAVPVATIAAARSRGGFDKVSRVGAIVAFGLPGFWLALMLQWVLGSWLQILPISGRISVGVEVPHRTGMTLVDAALAGDFAAFSNAFQHLMLPAFVLSVAVAAQMFRALRADLVRVRSRDHMTVAQAKGVPILRLWTRHALPNATGPLLNIIGIEIGMLVGSAIFVESVFGLSGVGDYLSNAVSRKDITAVIGTVTVVGVIVVVANFIVDMLQLAHDPRLRTPGKVQ
ncbi:ABC transporter permease [Rhodococcus opacus]|uniref:ABC transporter permease n=1 Tax=Rhodococcus opacus TaxID=37919 RepID=UPI0002DC05E9|nr:ABC transporter permease [Rhodococcus opacus]AHK29366.1 Dipeptide transport system permease protein dppB [Rhodococcus opacus PD630]UDG99140.1 ABC transporter permease [Rhodococcus opacus PD630]